MQPTLYDGSDEGSVPQRRSTVGSSDRTPCKHQLMDRIIGREIRVLNSGPRFNDVPGTFWVDLTAGDGVAYVDDGPWEKNCSPGILARHALYSRKPAVVRLYEKAPRTYRTLLGNLERELKQLGYAQESETAWTHGHATIAVFNTDSATFDPLLIPPTWAVQIINDPNSINTWAMRPGLMNAISHPYPGGRQRWACLAMSTMGCNVAGSKRLNESERDVWYRFVRDQAAGLHSHHDLLLAAIERDASQWAYLLTVPRRWKEETAKAADGAFAKGGFTLQKCWLKDDRQTFQDLCDKLFKTAEERKDR